jgi:hypothetical protein
VAEISPSDIRGHYRVKVDLVSSVFGDQAVNLPVVLQLLGAKLISRLTASRMLAIPAPEAEQDRILYEEIRELPAIKSALAEQALRQLDPELYQRVEELSRQMGGTGAGGQGGIQMNINVTGQQGQQPPTAKAAQLSARGRAGQSRTGGRRRQQGIVPPPPLAAIG